MSPGSGTVEPSGGGDVPLGPGGGCTGLRTCEDSGVHTWGIFLPYEGYFRPKTWECFPRRGPTSPTPGDNTGPGLFPLHVPRPGQGPARLAASQPRVHGDLGRDAAPGARRGIRRRQGPSYLPGSRVPTPRGGREPQLRGRRDRRLLGTKLRSPRGAFAAPQSCRPKTLPAPGAPHRAFPARSPRSRSSKSSSPRHPSPNAPPGPATGGVGVPGLEAEGSPPAGAAWTASAPVLTVAESRRQPAGNAPPPRARAGRL